MNLEEMWQRLAQHQPYADRRGYGPEWARMCEDRTEAAAREAAWAAADAAWAAADAVAGADAEAAARAAAEKAADAAADVAQARAAWAADAVWWIERAEEQE